MRGETIKAIHATWRKIAVGLCAEELRDARLVFCSQALGLRHTLKSIKKLSPAQLGRVLDAMRERERAPALPGTEFRVPASAGSLAREKGPTEVGTLNTADGAEIHHLATAFQVEAIDKLFAFLGWGEIGIQGFVTRNFKKHSHRLLTPKEAQSCTFILLRIGASKSIKQSRQVERVSNVMIREEIPRLKVRLGIDVRKLTTENTEEEFNG